MTAGKSQKKTRAGQKYTRQKGHRTRAVSPSILGGQRPLDSLQSYLGTEAFKGSEAEKTKEQNKKGQLSGEVKHSREANRSRTACLQR